MIGAPDATPMLALGNGRWVNEVMLPPGRYEYLFFVDREWKCDPAAPEQVPNLFGTHNSVLEVPRFAPPTKEPEP
jgi:hypothetical protein